MGAGSAWAGSLFLLGACLATPASPVDAVPCDAGGSGCRAFACGDDLGCFLYCDQTLEQPEARSVCDAWGGVLVAVTGSDLDVCIADEVSGAAVWIGLHQLADQTAPGDGWLWSTGEPLGPYMNWDSNEPNDAFDGESGTEQCAEKTSSGFFGGTWNDLPCDRQQEFVCQR